MTSGITAITRYKCDYCGHEYDRQRTAELCAGQGDGTRRFKKKYGFMPKPGDILVLSGHWGWVSTQRREWFGRKQKGNGIHGSYTYDVYYLVVNVRRRERSLGEFRVKDKGSDYEHVFNAHEIIIDIVTRAHDLDDGNVRLPMGRCSWTSEHHTMPEPSTKPHKKIREQSNELIAYWTDPENIKEIHLF